MYPDVGCIKSNKQLKSVVFPAPLLPTRPNACPLGISNPSRLRTVTPLYDFDKLCIVIISCVI